MKAVILSPPVVIGNNTVIYSNTTITGPAVIGHNCEIGPFVAISPSTSIGDSVIIQPFCYISNSVISHDVSIGPGALIQDSVIDQGSEIKARFRAISDEAEVKVDDEYHRVKIGAMLGEDCTIASSVVAQSRVILGNSCRVGSLKLISGRLSDKRLIV